LKLNIAIKEPTGVISLSGALEIYDVESLRDVLLRELTGRGELVLDLAGVSSCDTAGVQLLCSARKTLEQRGKRFHIERASAAFLTCCQRLGLGQNGFGNECTPKS
jgi:anti-anti-sigma factor